ncbi:MAG: hypothetical protein NPMRTH1_400014 [Nitrosopumilales archaeon]|nr:MAG: hypothetical protein NPMRTH1_400014 [Nitrosopumilales archaeon]
MASNQNRTVVDFGTRVISDRCTSKIIALPKIALENLTQGKYKKLRIKLICEDGRKYLELSPVFDLEKVIH